MSFMYCPKCGARINNAPSCVRCGPMPRSGNQHVEDIEDEGGEDFGIDEPVNDDLRPHSVAKLYAAQLISSAA